MQPRRESAAARGYGGTWRTARLRFLRNNPLCAECLRQGRITPATVVDHDLAPGGLVHYYMTGPDGEKYYGGWRVVAVEEPHRFTFEDFFADEGFNPAPGMPVALAEFRFEPAGSGTKATFTTTYETAEAMQQTLDMGMEEGATLATNQIDALLAEG